VYIHYGTENQQIDSEKIGTPEEKGILEQASEKLLKKKKQKRKTLQTFRQTCQYNE